MKVDKKYLYGLIVFATGILLCMFFVCRHGMFASKIDWLSQHSVIPDYFRRRFYETKQLFPDMAWNLGGGQNIYNLSYYGLFSPVILISYFLPFVKMDVYIMVSSVICYALSGVTFFFWLQKKDLTEEIKILTTILFMLSSSLMFHFYNQLMFVNYMPFLILSLIGCDRYFKDGSCRLFVIAVVGMILTSYYFSIGGLVCICLYAFGKSEFKGKKMFHFGVILMLAVGICGILLVPTAFSLFSGERGGSVASDKNLLFSFVPQRFLYGNYGLGLPAIGLFGLLGGVLFAKNNRRRLQSVFLIALLCMPLAAKLLNGGLYEKDKVFIPFLPIVCLIIAETVNKSLKILQSKKVKTCLPQGHTVIHGPSGRGSTVAVSQGLLILLCIAVIGIMIYTGFNKSFIKYKWFLIADGGLLLLGTLINIRWKKIPLALFMACVIMFLYGSQMHMNLEAYITKDEYETLELDKKQRALPEIFNNNNGLYRVECIGDNRNNLANINRLFDIRQNMSSIYSSGYNSEYLKFRNEVFKLNDPLRNRMMQPVSDNPFFLNVMGVRFILDKKCPAGYSKLYEAEGGNVYENKNAAPICYATTKVMGENTYDELEFPYNQAALLGNVVVDKNSEPDKEDLDRLQNNLKRVDFKLPEVLEDNLKITECKGGYEITAKENTEINVPLSSENKDIFAFSCDVENLHAAKDMHIRINGQTNRLTAVTHEYANKNNKFHFVVTLDGEAKFEFSKGHYRISNIQSFLGDFEKLQVLKMYESELEVEGNGISGDCLRGKIDVKRDGYFVTGFPYDSSFKLLIDGKVTETLKVNKSFLGAKISQGQHDIEIIYNARGKRAGLALTIICIVVLSAMEIYRLRK